jgi:hypothetical protein
VKSNLVCKLPHTPKFPITNKANEAYAHTQNANSFILQCLFITNTTKEVDAHTKFPCKILCPLKSLTITQKRQIYEQSFTKLEHTHT